MARPLRIQYPGAVYHVTHRGNGRQAIFIQDADRYQFLKILFHAQYIYSVLLHGYVLMENHFHLLAETPRGNLSEFMRYFNITYTSYFNRTHGRSGHLYQGRYSSFLIEKETYLSSVSRYIHINPVRVNELSGKPQKEQLKYLFRYPWSSLPGFCNLSRRIDMITYGPVLEEFGGDHKSGRAAYRKQVAFDLAGNETPMDTIVGQSLLGSDTFIAMVRRKYMQAGKDRERPAVGKILKYRAQEEIIMSIMEVTGLSKREILTTPGVTRQIAMDMLYRYGGLTNPKIGRLMGIDYSTVSQGRRRLRTRLQKDKETYATMKEIEHKCQG